MTSITANDVALDDPCPSPSMNQMDYDAVPSKAQQVYSQSSVFQVVLLYIWAFIMIDINFHDNVLCTACNFTYSNAFKSVSIVFQIYLIYHRGILLFSYHSILDTHNVP